MAYIEPCCIDKQLPPVLKQPFAFFQSGGDWTVIDLMKAASYLVEKAVCVLVIPEVDVFLLRKLNTYLVKGWYEGVVLLTNTNQADLVLSEFGSNISQVHYATSAQVADGQFALTNFSNHLLVQGPMLLEKDFILSNYSSYSGGSSSLFKAALEAAIPKLRLHPLIESDNEQVKNLLDFKWTSNADGKGK